METRWSVYWTHNEQRRTFEVRSREIAVFVAQRLAEQGDRYDIFLDEWSIEIDPEVAERVTAKLRSRLTLEQALEAVTG